MKARAGLGDAAYRADWGSDANHARERLARGSSRGSDELSIHFELQSDWDHAFPFRMVRLESERDAALGQWSVQIAFLGIALILTWVYEETELRAELAAMMDDTDWLSKSHVSMPYADYQTLKADADKWRESQA